MKIKYVRWRNRVEKVLREAEGPLSSRELLVMTKDKRSPKNAASATQILMRDDRFIGDYSEDYFYQDTSANLGDKRRVFLWELRYY